MSESEQAQAITTFTKEERALYDSAVTCTQTELSEGSALLIDRAEELRDMLSNVLGLVDSQAQKIAEQAAETERLTKERNDARKLAEDSRDDEYDNDMDLSVAENRAARREYAKNHPLPWEKP